MHIQKLFWLTIAFALLTGCATGKTIKGAEDIQDDGKRNVVLLTSDIKLYVRDRHPSAEETKLTFKCPKGKSGFGGICFNITLPYLGTKEVDGFGLHAFESTGAKAIKMEYGDYAITSAFHGVVVDRIPETTCTYNKKLKKDQCRTRMKDKSDNHSAIFPTPIVVNVSPGTGCYLGHLQVTMVNDEIRTFNFDNKTALSSDRLTNLPSDVSASLLGFVDHPC